MADKAARRRTALPVLRVVVVAEVVVALLTAAAVAYGYQRLDDNIQRIPRAAHQARKHDDAPKQPVNILVLGSDSRDCAGCDIDGKAGGGERADMTILMHVSADRKRAYGISIARDTVIDRPTCTVDGTTIPGERHALWNTAFQVGGAACTRQTVEALTGIYVDHTVVVDFQGFQHMVDAVHGVRVCVPRQVDDPAHGILLPAGVHTLTGDQALDYVRERHVLSVNSDIGRMRRQQAFAASLIHRVISADTLAMPNRLYAFLDAATSSLTADEGLDSLREIYRLARQLNGIGLSDIKFVTAPVETYPANINHLRFSPDARPLWRTVREDRALGALSGQAISADDKVGKPDQKPTTPQARVRVENGLCA